MLYNIFDIILHRFFMVLVFKVSENPGVVMTVAHFLLLGFMLMVLEG